MHGGQTGRVGDYVTLALQKRPRGLDPESIEYLVSHYGSAYEDVLQYLPVASQGHPHDGDEDTLWRAEVVHAIRNEMAQKLNDAIYRRTPFGVTGVPTIEKLEGYASVMAEELGGDDLEQEFARLEGGDIDIEKRLSALKEEMGLLTAGDEAGDSNEVVEAEIVEVEAEGEEEVEAEAEAKAKEEGAG